MKVLHVIPSLAEFHGGPTRALLTMEEALAHEDVTVETVTTDDDGPGRRNGKPLGQPMHENGALHWYFAKRLEFYKPSPALARWMSREVRRFDLVHIHTLFSFTSTVAARAARRYDVPYVIRPLGTLNEYGMARRRPWLKALSMRFIEASVLRNAAAVHFTSEDEATQARKLGIPMREVVIPLGIPTPTDQGWPSNHQFSPLGGAGPNLLFLSRLDAKKNLEGLLAAIELLKAEMPRLHLVVAGNGDPAYVAALKAQAEARALSRHVRWVGHVDGEAKSTAFQHADLFVLPSYSENFGIAAVEALAAGLPCLLGEGVAITKDVVKNGAGMVVGTDAQSIAQGVRRIMADRGALLTLSANARRLASESYSVDAMGVSLKRLYSEILEQ